MSRIAIAIHGGENVDFGVYGNHLTMIAIASQKHELALITTRGVRIAQARCALINKALEMDCEYVLFIDTDHVIPENIIDFFLQDMKSVSCVSGLVSRKRDTMDVVAFVIEKGIFKKLRLGPNSGVVLVDICAFGCTMINMDVFKELKRPFFWNEPRATKNEQNFTIRSDVLFCESLGKLNKKVAIDTRVVVGHVGEPVVIWPHNAATLRAMSEKNMLGFQHT